MEKHQSFRNTKMSKGFFASVPFFMTFHAFQLHDLSCISREVFTLLPSGSSETKLRKSLRMTVAECNSGKKTKFAYFTLYNWILLMSIEAHDAH